MTTRVFLGVGYMLAAVACLAAWHYDRRRMPVSEGKRPAAFWLVVGMLLGTMGVLRATSLANGAEDATRRLAEAGGWYQGRRPLQLVAVITLLALGVWAAMYYLRRRDHDGRTHESVMTVIVLTSLIILGAVRTVSFHYSDSILSSTSVLGTNVGNLLEIAGIGLTIVLAVRAAIESREVTSQ